MLVVRMPSMICGLSIVIITLIIDFFIHSWTILTTLNVQDCIHGDVTWIYVVLLQTLPHKYLMRPDSKATQFEFMPCSATCF